MPPAPKPPRAPNAPKKHARAPSGRKTGRRADIPWGEIERLYIHGEVTPGAPHDAVRVWPTTDQLAVRFEVHPSTVRDHARANGWTGHREELRRKLAEEAQKATVAFVGKAADLWGPLAERTWKLTMQQFDELQFALEFHQSGRAAAAAQALAAASSGRRGGARGGGGDAGSQGDGPSRPPGADEDPARTLLLREPMAARDQKDLAATSKTLLENARALLFGTQPPATSPTTTGGGTPLPPVIGSDARTLAVLDRFVLFGASGNKAPAVDPK